MMVYQRNGAHSIFAIELIEYHLQVLIHVLCVSGNFEEFFFFISIRRWWLSSVLFIVFFNGIGL